MKFCELEDVLRQHPNKQVVFEKPGGQTVPQHFHLTEIGRSTKDFIDCGGTRRLVETCVLQTLVANDTDHRLSTSKFAAIAEKADALKIDRNAKVEVEVQLETVSIFEIANVTALDDELRFSLAAKSTACLAPDRCGIDSLPVLGGDDESCCGSEGCC